MEKRTTEYDDLPEFEEFRLRSYPKRALACSYFPASRPKVAVNQLTRWIKRCAPLLEELCQLGFNPNAKTYNRRQVEMIVKHLGEP